jgi:molybdopterin-guanine dinucleotide biosynthesis protein B
MPVLATRFRADDIAAYAAPAQMPAPQVRPPSAPAVVDFRRRRAESRAEDGASMKIFGLAGWSGSGKTTLTSRLLPELIGRGLTVSTMKHAHHSFDIDRPGKDSYVHRMAGASEVLVASANRWALMHEHRGAAEPSAAELIRHMTPVDLLLIEGFKREPHPKLEIYRQANGKPLLHPDDPHIVAVASDVPLPVSPLPVLSIDDIAAITEFILSHCGLVRRQVGEPQMNADERG